ncbi:MAG: hypothetical protein M5R36_27550 [Deltaproteobacteria bacterium]|nr:hypothetical protein [Deltaproteobacteria bacterium]
MKNEPTIVAHGDFDGMVSAAIVSIWCGIDRFAYAGPESVRRLDLDAEDIVCDLPHPMRPVRAWFDHHQMNIEEAKNLGLALGEGAAWDAPSAARVAYDHLKDKASYPDFMEETVAAGDRVDSMDYASVEEWRAESPENTLNRTIFLPGEGLRDARPFLIRLTRAFREMPLTKICEMPEVIERYHRYVMHADKAHEMIARLGQSMVGGRVLLLDFSEMKVPPAFSRNETYVVYPDVEFVLSVNPIFENHRKTNDLRISMSKNPFIRHEGGLDLAALFERLGVGGGHPSAVGGRITSESKEARQRALREVLAEIEEAVTSEG